MRSQHGVAVITALLIVAIAAAAAALMLSQQSAMLDQTAMVSTRAQADAYAQAGLDWARGVLAQDANAIDSLDEGWAQPIPALPVERAVISGQIVDEQGKFNLNNLDGADHKGEDDRIFMSLLGLVGLPTELIGPVKDWIDADGDITDPGSAEDPYYLGLARPYRAANRPMAQVDELYRVRGFDAKAVAKLRPYVTALPGHQAINVNTAPDLVLAALVGATERAEVSPLIGLRSKKAFTSAEDFAQKVSSAIHRNLETRATGVSSSYFSVRVQVAQEDVQLATDALVWRQADRNTVIIWRRPRY